MKITVPGFVTEQNVQEAVKRFAMKHVPLDPIVLTAVATAIGMLEQFGGDAAIAAGTPHSPDVAALGDIDPSTASLTQEQLKFVEAEAALRGADASEFMKFAPHMMKLLSQFRAFSALHPKKEISVTSPEETH